MTKILLEKLTNMKDKMFNAKPFSHIEHIKGGKEIKEEIEIEHKEMYGKTKVPKWMDRF